MSVSSLVGETMLEDKFLRGDVLNPYGRLVAEAIAAFQVENDVRIMNGLEPLTSQVSHGFVFYLSEFSYFPHWE